MQQHSMLVLSGDVFYNKAAQPLAQRRNTVESTKTDDGRHRN